MPHDIDGVAEHWGPALIIQGRAHFVGADRETAGGSSRSAFTGQSRAREHVPLIPAHEAVNFLTFTGRNQAPTSS
jgi:hypothetical protein